MVGDDGQVYLSGAPLSGELLVQWGDGANSRCIAHYVLPKQSLQQAVTVISAVCTHRLIKEIINEDNLQIIIGNGMFVSGKHIWATVCANSTGVAEDEHYDLSNVFNSTNNQRGQIVVLPEKSGWVGVSAICPPGTLVNYTYRSYVTNFIVQETIDNYKYMQLNDYLLGAMSLVDSVMDIQFPPQNYIRMGTDPNVSQNLPFGVMDSRLIFRLKVIRPFINMVEIPRQVMFTVYVTSTPNDPLVTPVYTISFGGRVEVPQNCELNAGQIVEFDFGDIGASLFSAAGPGNRPAGVMPQTKSIAIKCTNVAAQAYLTMRLEASAVSGQAMVSDNQDLGFIVADQNDTPITPNDLNSVIPFRLDAAAA